MSGCKIYTVYMYVFNNKGKINNCNVHSIKSNRAATTFITSTRKLQGRMSANTKQLPNHMLLIN